MEALLKGKAQYKLPPHEGSLALNEKMNKSSYVTKVINILNIKSS
jgi:hypothetical protein